jgi:hypothetical protein
MLQKKATANLISSGQKDLIYFPVYSPFIVDTQGEGIIDKSLMAAAHDWMVRGRMANVDIEHNKIAVNCRVVESFISDKSDTRFPIAGTWGAAMKIYDSSIVDAIEAGLINGVSLLTEYPPLRTRYPTVVSNPVSAVGTTELSLDPDTPQHSHSLDMKFDGDTNEIPVMTGESLGHRHLVVYGTATEMADGHAHRIDLNKLAIEYVQKLQLVTWLTDVSVIAISLVEHGANWMPLISLKRATEVVQWPAK